MSYLLTEDERAKLLVYDTALILKRLYLCERSLLTSEAGWIPATGPLEAKLALPRYVWEDSLTADALRQRVFELRFPNRMLEVGDDAPLLALFEEARNAPSPVAFFLGLAEVLKPAMLAAYRQYMALADAISDGPSIRFLRMAIIEKEQQVAELARHTGPLLDESPDDAAAARQWCVELKQHLASLGGLGLEPVKPGPVALELPSRKPFALAEAPARDARFWQCRFYWPDNIDPSFGYGEGMQLQLRTAISHLNEVWAVETAGALIYHFNTVLDWPFVLNAARWVYDESRHVTMGYIRLQNWGYAPEELPLGTYIFDSARGQDPIYRLGMLFFFETKNIGKKRDRMKAFASYGDRVSQRDMDFDWADEAIHAGYGKYWLGKLLKLRGQPAEAIAAVRSRCGELVAEMTGTATAAEHDALRRRAEAIIAKGRTLTHG